jgi:EcsC protein family
MITVIGFPISRSSEKALDMGMMGHKGPLLEGNILPNRLAEEDLEALRRAVLLLERESLAMRLANLVGKPIGYFERLVPRRISNAALLAAEAALEASLRVALSNRLPAWKDASGRWHKALATVAGAVGGVFGLPVLAVELPISTTILLHAIANIARAEGEDLSRPEAALACLEVFALGGRSGPRDPGDVGYHAVRAALAHSIARLGRYVAERGFVEESAPALLRLLSGVASRFGILVSQKVVAQAVPVLGAATGAAINAAFMTHFRSMARGHFIVRRLERIYGADLIATAYREVKLAEGL